MTAIRKVRIRTTVRTTRKAKVRIRYTTIGELHTILAQEDNTDLNKNSV
jgi:hypothetical protein